MNDDLLNNKLLTMVGDGVILDLIKEFKTMNVIDRNFQLSRIMMEELRTLMIAAIGGGMTGMIVSGTTDLMVIARAMEKQVMPMVLGFCKAVQLMDRMDVVR